MNPDLATNAGSGRAPLDGFRHGGALLLLGLAIVLGGTICLHWLLMDPVIHAPGNAGGAYSILPYLLARIVTQPGAPPAFAQFSFGVIAVTGLLASALAGLLLLRSHDVPCARHLSIALALGTLSGVMIFLAPTVSPLQEWLAARSIAARGLYDALAYGSGFAGLLKLIRFLACFPRTVTPDDWLRFQNHLLHGRQAHARSSWRLRWLPAPLFDYLVRDPLREAHIQRQRQVVGHFLTGPVALIAGGMAAAVALPESAARVLAENAAGRYEGLGLLLGGVVLVALIVGFGSLLASAGDLLHLHYREGTQDDRRRINWIGATMFVSSTLLFGLVCGLQIIGGLLLLLAPDLADRLPMYWFFPLPIALLPLFGLALVAALGLSIFYRGTADPRLMAYRLTAWSAFLVVLSVMFVVLERIVALALARWYGVQVSTTSLPAMLFIAATFQPLRHYTERGVNRFVARFMPLERMIEGPRRTVAVTFSDLSGYTSLFARDERQGLLVGALLQRIAAEIVTQHDGRLVRAIGDAVMLEFARAQDAARALARLHEAFPREARARGIEPLLVHSAAHWGDVVAPTDEDLFGLTVNVTARMMDEAGPGKIVMSEAFRTAADLAGEAIQPIGPRRFKNVPEPIPCFELLAAG